LVNLRSQVVLLNMWIFGWINCRNAIPSLREWFDKYGDQGLVIIGNHYPEFTHERDLDNLIEGLYELGILYPLPRIITESLGGHMITATGRPSI